LHTELNVDPTNYIRESMAVRGQFYASQVAIGAMTIAEVREAERFAPMAPTEEQPTEPPTEPQEADDNAA
jgi:hypothetical protein